MTITGVGRAQGQAGRHVDRASAELTSWSKGRRQRKIVRLSLKWAFDTLKPTPSDYLHQQGHYLISPQQLHHWKQLFEYMSLWDISHPNHYAGHLKVVAPPPSKRNHCLHYIPLKKQSSEYVIIWLKN